MRYYCSKLEAEINEYFNSVLIDISQVCTHTGVVSPVSILSICAKKEKSLGRVSSFLPLKELLQSRDTEMLVGFWLLNGPNLYLLRSYRGQTRGSGKCHFPQIKVVSNLEV